MLSQSGIELINAIFTILALSFVPASFVLYLISERASGGKHLQRMAGVSGVTYWLATFCWDMVRLTHFKTVRRYRIVAQTVCRRSDYLRERLLVSKISGIAVACCTSYAQLTRLFKCPTWETKNTASDSKNIIHEHL